mgnify:CR=1 FL=1
MCAPQNGIISHIITYHIIYHENPDLSTSFSIFLPFFYLFRHLSETARRKRRFLCILRCAGRDIYPSECRLPTPAPKIECNLSDHNKLKPSTANRQSKKMALSSRQRTYSIHDAPSRRRQHTCFAYVLIPALHFQRACRLACTNLLGFFV